MNITLQIEFNGESLRVDTDHAVDLSIPLEFGGPQPNHFDAPAATASPLESGTFVGDTREGGSCNCETLSLVPHCNGTHTECVGHVTDDRVAVNSIAPAELLPAALITVEPIRCEDTRESTAPRPEPKDHVITRSALSASLGQAPGDPPEALIVRTKPNREEKRTRRYAESKTVPYFTAEAMEWLVKKNVRHLIVDTPSLALFGDGQIDLRNERLDLEFDREARKVSVTQVLPPFRVGGTLASPEPGLAVGAVAGRILDLSASIVTGTTSKATAAASEGPERCRQLLASYARNKVESAATRKRAVTQHGDLGKEGRKAVKQFRKFLFGD